MSVGTHRPVSCPRLVELTTALISPQSSGYTPPEGFKLAKVSVDKSEFDWDSINRDPNVQLWAIKVPKGVSRTLHRHQTSPSLSLSPSPGQPGQPG